MNIYFVLSFTILYGAVIALLCAVLLLMKRIREIKEQRKKEVE